ncbi:neutral zinc metallopeptidase [Thermaurantiacus sp.]|uniref:KPN_02809 family neutral zinc metallopeptidase n=1 Tax=Thermaurantiacus sp. TaxID=2820283 RepID=UPI00298F1EDF|nr:neutral zinc metallopeptidase [Thermaurantiacus sp.]
MLGLLYLGLQFLGLRAPSPVISPPAPPGRAEALARSATNRFVARALGSTEDTWTALFAERGQRHPMPSLVPFDGQVNSACGLAQSVLGPFHCPADRKVRLDTGLFDELARRFGAPGACAAAYAIAHEVGHHVQNVLGILEASERLKARASRVEANRIQVRVELQADCLAGVWASRNRDLLDEGDFAEGVRAAQAIGDDVLMAAAGRRVVPDAFTHGSAERRVRWPSVGVREGRIEACDTFAVPDARL